MLIKYVSKSIYLVFIDFRVLQKHKHLFKKKKNYKVIFVRKESFFIKRLFFQQVIFKYFKSTETNAIIFQVHGKNHLLHS